MSRILIKNCWAVTVDPDLEEIRGADILVEGGVIVDVRPGIEASDAETVDATDMIAIPGFVDTHRHTWQALVRGVGCDWTLDDYFQGIRGMVGWKYRPEDVYAGNLVGTLESLNAGVTTLVDWSHIQNSPEHTDAAIRALRDAGTRAMFGYGAPTPDGSP